VPGCHAINRSDGLALENLDGLGQLRETENGARSIRPATWIGVSSPTRGLGKAVSANPPRRRACGPVGVLCLGRKADDKSISPTWRKLRRRRLSFPALLRRIGSRRLLRIAPAPPAKDPVRRRRWINLRAFGGQSHEHPHRKPVPGCALRGMLNGARSASRCRSWIGF